MFLLFIENSLLILHSSSSPPPSSAVSEQIKQAREKFGLDPAILTALENMIEDLKYLETMKEMEEEKERREREGEGEGGGGGGWLANVVPLSGLILSCFFRREQELRTALELWDAPIKGRGGGEGRRGEGGGEEGEEGGGRGEGRGPSQARFNMRRRDSKRMSMSGTIKKLLPKKVKFCFYLILILFDFCFICEIFTT